jgi:hypothetical protein
VCAAGRCETAALASCIGNRNSLETELFLLTWVCAGGSLAFEGGRMLKASAGPDRLVGTFRALPITLAMFVVTACGTVFAANNPWCCRVW